MTWKGLRTVCLLTGGYLLWVGSAFGETRRELIDLTTGISFPSNSAAVTVNPAGLYLSKSKLFDLRLMPSSAGELNFGGSFTAGTSAFGYGFDVSKIGTGFYGALGLGVSAGSFSFGLSMETPFASFSPSLNFGMRKEFSTYILSLVFWNLGMSGQNWALGFGVPIKKMFRLSLDFILTSSSPNPFAISEAEILGSFAFYANQTITLSASYGVSVVPVVLSRTRASAGLCVWLSRSAGAYVELGGFSNYDITAGFKFLL